MKRLAAAALALLALALAFAGLGSPLVRKPGTDLARLADAPVLEGGRVKPLDSVARNSLLLLRGKQTALDADGKRVPALEWFLHTTLDPKAAAPLYRVFRVDHPDLLALLDVPQGKPYNFTYAELEPKLSLIDKQSSRIDGDAKNLGSFEQALLQLRRRLIHYQNLTEALRPSELEGPIAGRYLAFQKAVRDGWALRDPRNPGTDIDAEAYNRFINTAAQLQTMSASATLLVVPPAKEGSPWKTAGDALTRSVSLPELDAVALGYAKLADAYVAKDEAARLQAIENLETALAARAETLPSRNELEVVFNRLEPFYTGMELYALTAVLGMAAWLFAPAFLQKAAFRIAIGTWVLNTAGLALRVHLSGYAPVTNLYSSAVFVGWGAVALALVLERMQKNGLGTVVASVVGFCSLLVAHHLAAASGGDTMEMMRAVLDSNFWLSTHVVTVTLGYSATFLAGFIAALHVVRAAFRKDRGDAEAAGIDRMLYGTIAFALLLSFVGTVLGGIWADQSWGRFWGWDPKENGALLIVIWNALILHVKRAKLVGRPGLLSLIIAGNAVTAWSWFGTNMLGIGLHSYGFMDQAFLWLVAFWGLQAALVGLTLLRVPDRRALQ